MSLVARVLEENGISTVTFSNARDITTSAGNPRLVFSNYPLGNCTGKPFNVENQREILRAGFGMLENSKESGAVVDTPYVWSDDAEWMRLIFTDEQPFISDDAEAERQEVLKKARIQKAKSEAAAAGSDGGKG